MDTNAANDLEAIDQYIINCRDFINPKLFRDINNRGLYKIINGLPYDVNEAKAIARARLAKIGKSFGDEEIDQIANTVQRMEFLRDELNKIAMTDTDKVIPIVNELITQAQYVRDYFKTIKY
jgi:hypothetical protein